ncbi:MAG: D-glycero-beta-D-manno-heptose 1-phosphate adenylyltransferase [Myxococcota bacterium]
MPGRPLDLLDAFVGLKVVVIGEAILDSWMDGRSERICREAPVPTVDLGECVDAPGGAANTAANAGCLGAQVSFLSVMGDDAEGERLRQQLEQRGVDLRGLLTQPGRRTLSKHRVMANGQMLLRLDRGDTCPPSTLVLRRLVENMAELHERADVVIVSDYGYGILNDEVLETLRDLQASRPRLLIVDAKNLMHYRGLGVTAVKPNYEEARRLMQEDRLEDEDRTESALRWGPRILDVLGCRVAAVTLDQDGAMLFERGQAPYRVYAQPVVAPQVAGAGDTFVSTFALALAAGAHTPMAAELASSAADLASAAAGIVISKRGMTASCSLDELRAGVAAGDEIAPDLGSLAATVERYRRLGKRTVFTNGCFDILHRGHITYLNEAKAQGDVLIVGVNSDQSVQRLKGPGRPINRLEDRLQVLSALSCIDHLIAFDEETPHRVIEAIRPDVFVKGGDYTREHLPEASLVEALGGEVRILRFVDDRSTTEIIRRIRGASAGGESERRL